MPDCSGASNLGVGDAVTSEFSTRSRQRPVGRARGGGNRYGGGGRFHTPVRTRRRPEGLPVTVPTFAAVASRTPPVVRATRDVTGPMPVGRRGGATACPSNRVPATPTPPPARRPRGPVSRRTTTRRRSGSSVQSTVVSSVFRAFTSVVRRGLSPSRRFVAVVVAVVRARFVRTVLVRFIPARDIQQ